MDQSIEGPDVAADEDVVDQSAPPDQPANSVSSILAVMPRGLLIMGLWAVCLLVIGLAVWGVALLAGRLSEVVLPVFAAFLLTAALQPLRDFLVRRGTPAWLAALICLLFLVVVVGGLMTLVAMQIVANWTELSTQTVSGFRTFVDWLNSGRLHVSQQQMNTWMNSLTDFLTTQSSNIASLAASIGTSIVKFVTGLIMCLFAIFFFLKDGERFSKALRRLVPSGMRSVVSPAASAGWASMVAYVRAAVTVAACDGAGAGLGALILGSNLWVAIMALTFVFAFVPMLGALVAGGVGCIIILATLGWVKALIMLAIFVVVLETEVHVMQPLLLGRAVDIHPLIVLLSIAIGIVIAGIPGGVFAIPLVALIVGVVRAAIGDVDEPAPPGVKRRSWWKRRWRGFKRQKV
ncbi:MAG: AI-2E family transporter [Propionibacteriaceae bacterium]|nr:AI-2E family transporter [Propionibacteriaceae bacterium]